MKSPPFRAFMVFMAVFALIAAITTPFVRTDAVASTNPAAYVVVIALLLTVMAIGLLVKSASQNKRFHGSYRSGYGQAVWPLFRVSPVRNARIPLAALKGTAQRRRPRSFRPVFNGYSDRPRVAMIC